MTAVILESTLTCPRAATPRPRRCPPIPVSAVSECERCHVLKPKPGDLCVLLYGCREYPPIQERGRAAAAAHRPDSRRALNVPSLRMARRQTRSRSPSIPHRLRRIGDAGCQ